MNGSTRRVALALCVVAVVLAALLFPATGLDAAPDGPVGSEIGGSGPGDASTPSAPPGVTPTPIDGTDSGGPDGSTATPTPTDRTATPAQSAGGDAATPTDSDGRPSDDDAGGLAQLGSWVAALVVVVGIAFVAVGEGKSRDWPVFRQLPVPAVTVTGLGQAASTASMSFLVRLSSSVPGLLAGLSTAAGATGSVLSGALAGAGRGLGAAVVAVPRGVGRALGGLSGGLTGRFSTTSRTAAAGGADSGSFGGLSGSPDPTDGDEEAEDDPPATVEDAWVAMVERLPGGHRETKTPGELARLAVDRGFPADPVETLTDTFRRVTYGGASPGDELTDEALAALARIERGPEGEE